MCYTVSMRWLILSVLLISNLALADEFGSGERLAQPPTVILAEIWHYNAKTPVYQVDIEHADDAAELQAAAAAVASVRPEFREFDAKFQQVIGNYVAARQDTGQRTRIYILRTIVADWLITS